MNRLDEKLLIWYGNLSSIAKSSWPNKISNYTSNKKDNIQTKGKIRIGKEKVTSGTHLIQTTTIAGNCSALECSELCIKQQLININCVCMRAHHEQHIRLLLETIQFNCFICARNLVLVKLLIHSLLCTTWNFETTPYKLNYTIFYSSISWHFKWIMVYLPLWYLFFSLKKI